MDALTRAGSNFKSSLHPFFFNEEYVSKALQGCEKGLDLVISTAGLMDGALGASCVLTDFSHVGTDERRMNKLRVRTSSQASFSQRVTP